MLLSRHDQSGSTVTISDNDYTTFLNVKNSLLRFVEACLVDIVDVSFDHNALYDVYFFSRQNTGDMYKNTQQQT